MRSPRLRYFMDRKRAISEGKWKPTKERRSTPHASFAPVSTDVAWAAGFIEGEGGFSAIGDKRGGGISVKQKSIEPLEHLQQVFGGSITHMIGKKALGPFGLKGRPLYHLWRVSGVRGRGVAMTIYQFLSKRRQMQARRVWERTNALDRWASAITDGITVEASSGSSG